MPYTDAPTIGDFLDDPTPHKTAHDGLKSRIDVLQNQVPEDTKASYGTVLARLDAESILRTTLAATPGAGVNVDRFKWETDQRRLQIGTLTGWETLLAPAVFKLKLPEDFVGINPLNNPLCTLHVRTTGSGGEPAGNPGEVIRGTNTASDTSEAIASLIGGGEGAAKLVFGDLSTWNRAYLGLNALTGSMEMSVAGQVKAVLESNGRLAVRKDGLGAFPDLGPGVVIGAIRNSAADLTATIATIVGPQGTGQFSIGTDSNPNLGMLAYNVQTDTMSLFTNGSETQRWYSSGRSAIIKSTPGGEAPWTAPDVFRVQRNDTSEADAAIQVIAGEDGDAELAFGHSGNGRVSLIRHENSTSDIVVITNGAENARFRADGRLVVTRDGVTEGAFDVGEVLRLRNGTASQSASLKIISSDTGTAKVAFAATAGLELASFGLDNSNGKLRAAVGAKTLLTMQDTVAGAVNIGPTSTPAITTSGALTTMNGLTTFNAGTQCAQFESLSIFNGAVRCPNLTVAGGTGVVATVTGTLALVSSTERIKQNVESLTPELCVGAVKGLTPVRYELDPSKELNGAQVTVDRPGRTLFGFTAENVAAVAPELARYDDESVPFGESRAHSLALNGSLEAVLVGAVQDLLARMEAQEAK